MDNLVIVDGKSVFYRAYYAMSRLSLPDGTPTGGVYGFAAMLLEILEKLQPEYIVIAWDKAKTNIRSRRAIYPDYKANRKAAPEDFYAQIPLLMELLKAFHIPLYEFDDYEADDIIGTVAKKAQTAGVEVQIISSDLDMLQIVDRHISLFQLRRGFSDVAKFDISALEHKYQLKKNQFLDLKSLKGDSSDNIPGIPGVGEKTAISLLQKYQTLDGVYAHLDEIKNSLHDKLTQNQKLAYISKQLASIRFDAPVDFEPDASRLADFDHDAVLAVLKKLQFNSLTRKFLKLFPDHDPIGNIASDQPATPYDDREITIPDNLYLSYHVKDDLHADAALAAEILTGRPFWDLGQVDFLLDPLTRERKQLDLLDQNIDNLRHAYAKQRQQLSTQPALTNIAEHFDLPLIPVLFKMERTGVAISPRRFESLRQEFSAELNTIEQEIFTLAGRAFNLNSPLQLSEILFLDLGLPTKGIKKTQRAFSTGQKELDKLRPLHPIITKIERHREVNKLLSTYVIPLPSLADNQHRIHTTYTQNITATGRLSSLNPNLQNIPVRSSDGRRIRDCFIAEKGKVFVSADYAQFELRLAAAIAHDEQLIAYFNANLDIHTKTASDAFDVPPDQVTKHQRRAAKVINFGVLYGMSAKSLADGTGMTNAEASAFIKRYFELRAPIRRFLDDTLKFGREHGYVETFFGRRRPTPDLHAPNFQVRAAAERAAANMPIQGTEADLMKKAMLAIDAALPPDANLILQVHDSLIVECPKNTAKTVSTILRTRMENIAPELPVRLSVDVTTADNWGDL